MEALAATVLTSVLSAMVLDAVHAGARRVEATLRRSAIFQAGPSPCCPTGCCHSPLGSLAALQRTQSGESHGAKLYDVRRRVETFDEFFNQFCQHTET
mgnify:CR=1 FL=1